MQLNHTILSTGTLVKISDELSERIDSLSESYFRTRLIESFLDITRYIAEREGPEFLINNVIHPTSI